MHFKCFTLSKCHTGLAAIENQHCPNKFGCSYMYVPSLFIEDQRKCGEHTPKQFTLLRWKDVYKYMHKEIVISGTQEFTSCPSIASSDFSNGPRDETSPSSDSSPTMKLQLNSPFFWKHIETYSISLMLFWHIFSIILFHHLFGEIGRLGLHGIGWNTSCAV